MSVRPAWRAVASAAAALIVAGVGLAAPGFAADESISAKVTTAKPMVGQELTIEGDVTGAAMYPVSVVATREDSTGVTAMPVDSQTTDANGHFTLHDTPPARGSVTYHLSADMGAATTDVATKVAGKPADLSIHVHPSPAAVDDTVHVTAHLGAATTNREVTLYLRPYRGTKTQFDQGAVDANGDRSADHAVHRRTTFIASFAGDSAYAPATARTTLRVRAVLDEALKGYFRTSGGARLYHRDDNPVLAVHMLPERKGACLYFRAQHKSHGSWVRSAVSSCVHTDSTGRAIGVLQGHHITGVAYRLRAEWHGTTAVARRDGEWMHLEFRRKGPPAKPGCNTP
jgi:hypothetical protein